MNKELRFLIVDDNLRMAKTLVDILKVKGYSAKASYSAQEALEKITTDHFDCVLTDIKTPEISGIELYKNIRTKQPKLPVILMTAHPFYKLEEDVLEECELELLAKPLDINLLLSFFSSIRKERSIAIVDNDTQFLSTLGNILRLDNFSIVQINNLNDVFEKISGDWQVLLIDMKLNEKNSINILKGIRNKYLQLPIILITSYQKKMNSMIDAALSFSVHIFLYKRHQIERLIKVLIDVYNRDKSRLLYWSVMK